MTSNPDDLDIPEELLDKLQVFDESFEKMKTVLEPLLTLNINSTDHALSPLDRAHLNFTCGYALNSLFWMYLNTLGIDPKEHKIKSELDNYKNFMARIKEMEDKDKAPKLDQGAAGRFVRNALWEPKEPENEASSSKEPQQRRKQNRSGPFSQKQDRKKRRY